MPQTSQNVLSPVFSPMAQPLSATDWSVIRNAGNGSAASRAALERLCVKYCPALYAFARRDGLIDDAAQDAVQDFVARLLEKEYLTDADRDRGKFRSFLLTAFKRFLQNERKAQGRQKRGGDRTHLSLDVLESGAGEFWRATELSPQEVYERCWAQTTLDRSMSRLAEDMERVGKGELFQSLAPKVQGEGGEPYQRIAERHGVSEGVVKVTVHRMRRRFREILRSEIADTVEDIGSIDDEIRHFISLFAR